MTKEIYGINAKNLEMVISYTEFCLKVGQQTPGPAENAK